MAVKDIHDPELVDDGWELVEVDPDDEITLRVVTPTIGAVRNVINDADQTVRKGRDTAPETIRFVDPDAETTHPDIQLNEKRIREWFLRELALVLDKDEEELSLNQRAVREIACMVMMQKPLSEWNFTSEELKQAVEIGLARLMGRSA